MKTLRLTEADLEPVRGKVTPPLVIQVRDRVWRQVSAQVWVQVWVQIQQPIFQEIS